RAERAARRRADARAARRGARLPRIRRRVLDHRLPAEHRHPPRSWRPDELIHPGCRASLRRVARTPVHGRSADYRAGMTAESPALPSPLVSTQWLADHPGADGLIVVDASVASYLRPDGRVGYLSGHEQYLLEGLVAGAVFADLVGVISYPHCQYHCYCSGVKQSS